MQTRVSITGFEHNDSRLCWWCGGALPKRRRHWCCEEHMHEYERHYIWTYARDWCLKRYGNRCANCGARYIHISTWPYYSVHNQVRYGETEPYAPSSCLFTRNGLQAHHIVPLDGEYRVVNALNHPDNLIALCTVCHGEVKAAENYNLQDVLEVLRLAVVHCKIRNPAQMKWASE